MAILLTDGALDHAHALRRGKDANHRRIHSRGQRFVPPNAVQSDCVDGAADRDGSRRDLYVPRQPQRRRLCDRAQPRDRLFLSVRRFLQCARGLHGRLDVGALQFARGGRGCEIRLLQLLPALLSRGRSLRHSLGVDVRARTHLALHRVLCNFLRTRHCGHSVAVRCVHCVAQAQAQAQCVFYELFRVQTVCV